MEPSLIERLAEISAGITYDQLPPEVVREAKRLILDTLACALGGYDGEPCRIARETACALGGEPESTVIGDGRKVPALWAAFANGAMLRYLDCNDMYLGRDPGHPSGNIAPALAVAERQRAGGKDLIAAVVAGYEVQCRFLDHAGVPRLWDRGWDHVTNAGAATAAAAGKLLGLSVEQLAHAMAIGVTHASTLTEFRSGQISMIKATAHAWISHNGVLAALLAERGMTGPRTILEGRFGYCRVVANGCDEEALVAPLEQHRILKACMKPWSAEGLSMGAIQAALEFRHQEGVAAEEVERIVIRFHEYAFRRPTWDASKLDPKTREAADHSAPYCVAAALVDGELGPRQFQPDRLQDPRIRGLMARTELAVDESMNALWPATQPAELEVRLRDGRRLVRRVEYPLGHYRNRMSDDDLFAKLRDLAGSRLPTLRLEQLRDTILALEEVHDLSEVTRLLAW